MTNDELLKLIRWQRRIDEVKLPILRVAGKKDFKGFANWLFSRRKNN
jgi:hypothetical protein